MEVVPSVKVTRFEQLEPGELFLHLDGRHSFYALKTAPPVNGDRSEMVMLGPSFFEDASESLLLPWGATTVLSLGKKFSILLPTGGGTLSTTGPSRTPVCLAIVGERAFICTNGSRTPQRYLPCFVELATGSVLERHLPGLAAYTPEWEIAVLGANHPPRTILKYPS
jgi:hypothetical protein